MDVAMRKGQELENVVKDIIRESNLPKSKIRIVHWKELEDEYYLNTLKKIQDVFENDQKFRDTIIGMVRETSHIASLKLQDPDFVKLSQYIIDELPILINGVCLDGDSYSLFPYPGFAKLDYLALDLQEGKSFPELTSKLEIKNKLRFIEAYAE